MIVAPAIFLLDEPFSNLDAAFRAYMRAELKRIQHEIGQTMVYVTHDQVEAMGMADRIAVMNLGVLQQYGTPDEIYNRPANRFVANFVGSVLNNFLPCRYSYEDGRGVVRISGGESRPLDVSDRREAVEGRAGGDASLMLAVRPERIRLVAPDDPGAILTAKVLLVEPLGAKDVTHLTYDGLDLRASLPTGQRPRVGDRVGVAMDPADVHLFDEATGLALR
jgi:multiple sugar transport system ATP-binding protein